MFAAPDSREHSDSSSSADGDGEDAAKTGSLSRRSLLRAAGTASALPFLASVSSTTARAADAWTMVVLPDTQFYAEDRSDYAADQTRWIVDNLDSENIAFVSHVGDVVEHGDQTGEWEHLDGAMGRLDGAVPYSTLPGNHDYANVNLRGSGVENYVDYFGASRYDGYDWYGGAGPGDEETNSYQLFSAGGYDFLHLALEWEPRDSTLEWARGVVEEHAGVPTILTTHSYLTDGDSGTGDPGRTRFVQEREGDGNSGQTVWEELVEPNSQVFMVLNGHFVEGDGEYRQVSENAEGQPVYEMVADFQNRANGGDGWLRLVSFVPGGGEDAPDRIRVRTYSPSLDEFEDDGDSEFGFDLDFASRFSSSSDSEPEADPLPEPSGDVWFQQGTDGYDGTADTNLLESDPETSYASAATVNVDGSEPQDSNDDAQALLRFDGVVGDGDGQIPPDATVEQATLTVATTDDGSGAAVHRMLAEWSDGDTWSSLDGGVRADGSDAASDPVTETGSVSTGTTTMDVTASVRAWVDGEPNYGWALLPLGDDGWEFSTAEGPTPPRLSVNYAETVTGDADGDGDVDGDDVELVQRDVANEDVDIDRSAADADGDGDVDVADVVRIDNERGSQ